MTKRDQKKKASVAKKAPQSNESTPTTYPIAPPHMIDMEKKLPPIDDFKECNYTSSEYYNRDTKKKINGMIKDAWESTCATPWTNIVGVLGMFYEKARNVYTGIEGTKISGVDNRCKVMFDIGMLLLASVCASTARSKKAVNVHASMVSND